MPPFKLLMVELNSLKGTLPKMFNFWSKMQAPLVPKRFSKVSLSIFFSVGAKRFSLETGATGGAAERVENLLARGSLLDSLESIRGSLLLYPFCSLPFSRLLGKDEDDFRST